MKMKYLIKIVLSNFISIYFISFLIYFNIFNIEYQLFEIYLI